MLFHLILSTVKGSDFSSEVTQKVEDTPGKDWGCLSEERLSLCPLIG